VASWTWLGAEELQLSISSLPSDQRFELAACGGRLVRNSVLSAAVFDGSSQTGDRVAHASDEGGDGANQPNVLPRTSI
jgi:hypothetical protein